MNKAMLLKQYLSYHKKASARLPSAYQEVEYIESTGTQYIDTLVNASVNLKVQMRFKYSSPNGLFFLYRGDRNASSTSRNCWRFLFYKSGYWNKYVYIFDLGLVPPNEEEKNGRVELGTDSDDNYSPNDIEEFEFGNTYIKDLRRNKIKYSANSPQEELIDTYPIYLFCGTPLGYKGDYGRCYYLKMEQNGVLVRDFIPCYRKSDMEVGLYDIVNNQFYTNSGSGSFLKGKDVIYTPTNAVSFATDSWSTIQAEAERISNFYEKYGFIPFNTPYGIYNPENNDTNNIRKVIYNNEEIQIAIIGMCHDTLQTPYSGGGTKAGITWQTTKILFKSAVNSSSSSGGWSSCSLRASLNSTHFNSLPQEMQNVIKVVAKNSNNGSGSITTTNDKLFTLSMVEIMGTTKRNSSTNFAIEGEGTQYEYYKNAPLIIDSKNITWTGLSGTKGTCIANGNSYMTLIDGVQTPDANDYVNYRNAKEYKLDVNESYYSTRSFRDSYNECMFIWITGIVSYSSATNSKLGVVFAGCI